MEGQFYIKEVGMEKKVVKAIVKSKSPAELIAAAVSKDTDLDKLEKLLVLQERWEGNEAKKAYHKAMAEFKANPPKIDKDKKVGYDTSKGKVGYSHASLANVTDKVNTELSKYDLSASWSTKQNGQVVVTCKITHAMGHSEETTLAAAADMSGSKNAIQAIGSAITYLQRYTLLSLTGLAAHDMDDDGKSVVEKGLNQEDKDILQDWMVSASTTATPVSAIETKVLKLVKKSSIGEMTKKDFSIAVSALKAAVKKNESN